MHPTLKSEWIHRAIYAKLVYEFVVVILLHRCDRETVDYDFSLSAAVVPFSACTSFIEFPFVQLHTCIHTVTIKSLLANF